MPKKQKQQTVSATCPACSGQVVAAGEEVTCECGNLLLKPDGRAFARLHAPLQEEPEYRHEPNIPVQVVDEISGSDTVERSSSGRSGKKSDADLSQPASVASDAGDDGVAGEG